MWYNNKTSTGFRYSSTLTLVTFWKLRSFQALKLWSKSNSGASKFPEQVKFWSKSNSGASQVVEEAQAVPGGTSAAALEPAAVQWGAPHFSNLGTRTHLQLNPCVFATSNSPISTPGSSGGRHTTWAPTTHLQLNPWVFATFTILKFNPRVQCSQIVNSGKSLTPTVWGARTSRHPFT